MLKLTFNHGTSYFLLPEAGQRFRKSWIAMPCTKDVQHQVFRVGKVDQQRADALLPMPCAQQFVLLTEFSGQQCSLDDVAILGHNPPQAVVVRGRGAKGVNLRQQLWRGDREREQHLAQQPPDAFLPG